MDSSQQAYALQQNKGTLVQGQSISVNKYTVQVERYLSQGGFAHVYLVRTATPVYNTTHHVLKRIAVANEAMLTDVKKEVDIMRLLKGHPNIVHLIDAAWHRMSNGLYEVFILMEFCPGGGIIDMMNRRLRERLTEAEILQIFVDVCEGVAYMHNSRPPLLHRDLKVENILQASATLFKLCDFGSATTASTKPPGNIQEVRALEEDLNRHTTLQYRAPEMIDPHLRRPIDEKSDVWALGVLLYKLCYYTTPFEEHGPLAILNVQYRIPPYPVYSPQMNALIASMLREHGTQRPSVFELLAQVHRLRSTKSQFQYDIPPPQPLSPRNYKAPASNPIQSTISYRQGPIVSASVNNNSSGPSSSLSKNAGVQARDKVLDAIAPMRRGRPAASKESSRSSSPTKGTDPASEKNWLEDDDKAWQAATAKSTRIDKVRNDTWGVGADRASSKPGQKGFGDDFGEQLWRSANSNPQPSSASVMKITVNPTSTSKSAARPLIPHRINDQVIKPAVRSQGKDAFDGLGLFLNETPAPTLAEARKLRTGLAISTTQYSNAKYGNNSSAPRLSPSPRPSYALQSSSGAQSLGVSPTPIKSNTSGSSWSSQPPSTRPSSSQPQSSETIAAESKFPSLEELDASFVPVHNRQQITASSSAKLAPLALSEPQLLKPTSPMKPIMTSTLNVHRPVPTSASSLRPDGVRSEQVTGFVMRAGFSSPNFDALNGPKPSKPAADMSRDPSVRKHRSSLTTKMPKEKTDIHFSSSISSPIPQKGAPSEIALHPPRSSQHDWLTGDDDLPETPSSQVSQPVLRESPSKRASYIERSHVPIQEAKAVTPESLPSTMQQELESPSRRAYRVFPDLESTAEPNRAERLTETGVVDTTLPEDVKEPESASSADEEGPEDVNRIIRPPSSGRKNAHKGRQSSVHDLVDLWGGGGRVSPEKKREHPRESTKSTVTPLPKPEGLARRRSLVKPIMPADTRRRRSISPQPATSPGSAARPSGTSASQQSNLRSPTSSTSSRSRPQSMFIFPSKSVDSSAPPSAGLSPPEIPQPRTTRRTSISDMVQRYEAIGTVAKTGMSSSMRPTLFPDSSTPQHISSSKRDGQGNGNLLPVQGTQSSPAQPRSTSSGIPRRSPSTFTASSTLTDEPHGVATPRARRTSNKVDAQTNSRIPTLPDDRSGDIRSPSPERPYQGVGRLIDQWQRKTAESEATRTPAPKRNVVTKRATLVNGTD
ncbi:hypothetical protein D9757_010839 [Collybiopsis confluens]|uniref:non-specific serine/threonine protein kinase n=1 Tax=Collybiopsis confluens TaxID=2823264 RepID=A0A8H5GL50_9AGAR|nr:hypothetical protein D9757_010839 [Collybiopsis confluens]